MTAVTIEDCLKIVPNRFELSLIVSYRAKQLINGAVPLYATNRVDKTTVIALEEIGKGLLDITAIKAEVINNIKNKTPFKNIDNDLIVSTKKELDDLTAEDEQILEETDEDTDTIEINTTEDDEYYNNLEDIDVDGDIDDDAVDISHLEENEKQ